MGKDKSNDQADYIASLLAEYHGGEISAQHKDLAEFLVWRGVTIRTEEEK